MAGAGYKLFNTGDVLTAAQVNTYLQEQTVMVFANSTARTTALSGVLAEGMVSYLQDTNAVEVYNGSAWVGVSGAGDVTEVQAGTGISVASGTGPIPVVTNTMATAIDAEGDLIIGDAADAFQRLAIGSNGNVLTVDTAVDGKIKWAAVSSGGSTWTTFTPTLTNMTLGNGTSTWKYTEVGELVFIIGKIEWGSTTSLSGGFDVGGLPFNINSDYAAENPLGFMQLRDTGTQFYIGGVHQFIGNATKIDPVTINTSGTYAVQGGINATTPFTWTTNDVMGFWFSYRKA